MMCSLLLGAAYYFYIESTFQASHIQIAVDIQIDKEDGLNGRQLDLYIYETNEPLQIENPTVEVNKNKFKYVFKLNNIHYNPQIIRLDFENFNVSDKIAINRLEILRDSGESILEVNENKIIKSLFNYSESITIKDNSIYLTDSNAVFDPFILFNVKTLLFYNITLQLILLLPWCILFTKPSYNWIYRKFKNKDFETILVAMFLFVLPLKIAWLTFVTLLLLLISLIRFFFFSERVLTIAKPQIIFFSLFLLYILFGRVNELNDINLQLAFILIPVIFTLNKNLIDIEKFYKAYANFFSILMALIVINGVIFIVSLNEFYNIPAQNYFLPDNTKMLNQKMMWWLPYSHPTFLSSFFLVGLLFCQSLYLRKKISKNMFFLYFILSLVATTLLGSRIMLLMLFVFVLYFLFFLNKEKQGVFFLLIISVIFVLGLVVFIEFIDSNRSRLWNISFKAISENIFGYGVDSSRVVLSDSSFYLDGKYDTPPTENHSHNQYITILLELGIIAFIVFCFIIGYLGYVMNKMSDKVFVSIYFLFFVLLFTESLFKTATPLYFYTFIFCISSINQNNQQTQIKI